MFLVATAIIVKIDAMPLFVYDNPLFIDAGFQCFL